MTLLPIIGYSQNVSNLSPASGNAGQTLDVTITGTNTHFTDPNGTELYFGFGQGSSTTYINSLTVNSDVSMTANITIPLATATGNYSVQPINSIDGIIEPMDFHVNGITSALSSISPNSAVPGQTLDVTITGTDTHFADASSNNVHFLISQGSGTINVNSVTPVNNTTLTVNITVSPDTYTGSYGVSVSNNLDLSMSLYEVFNITGLTPAQITSIYPNQAAAGQTINMLVSAANSSFTQTTNAIDIGFGTGVGINSVDVFNDSLLLANVTVPSNASPGYKLVKVINSVNGTMTKSNGMLVTGTTVVSGGQFFSISPNTASAGQTLSVTITGTNTLFTQASTTSLYVGLESSNPNISILWASGISVLNDQTITGSIVVPADFPTSDLHVLLTTTNAPQMKIYNGFHIDGADPLFAFVVPTQESDEGACDGSAEIHVSGGIAPYSYTFDGTAYPNTVIPDLCEGYYTAGVMDNNGALVDLSFVIVPPNSVYTTQSYIDSLLADTVYNEVITECTIDYNAIDSVYIQSYTWLSGTEIVVTWHIAYGAGQTASVTDVYELSEFAGVSSLVLQLFCPNKSLSSSLVAYDQLYFNPETASVGEENALDDMIVYPNPFNGDLSIALTAARETTVTITDMTGKILKTVNSSEKVIHVDTGDLAAGQYFVTLRSEGAVAARKVVKL